MIGTVHLRVSNLRRALAFYRDLLGFKVIAPGVLAATESGPALLTLTELPSATKPGRTTGLYHVAIRVPGASALGRLLARLLAADYPLQGASDHPTNKAIYLADPDGNGIELTIDNPKAEWFGPDGQLRLASPPLDGQALLEAAGTSTCT
jgi:catechol 2,3-dioxygenase